jgi:hypothetical protein
LNFFPPLEIGALHILKQHTEREEGRTSREGSVRRDKEKAVVWKKKGNGIFQSSVVVVTANAEQRSVDKTSIARQGNEGY